MAWMRKLGAVRWLILVSVIVGAGAGCAVNPVSGRPELTLISAKHEQELGAEEAKKVEAQMGLLDDAQFHPYLDALGQRLAKESPRQDVTYQFHVADMAEPNAFALPGGYVYVSLGLLPLVNSEDELAGVVGHEIGHVAAQRTKDFQARSLGGGLRDRVGARGAGQSIQKSLRSPSRATSVCVRISNPVYLTHEATTIPSRLRKNYVGTQEFRWPARMA